MSYRLVVVAPEHATLRTLAGQLDDSIHIALFDNANDALWEVQANPPEVLIAEHDLPGMTGMDLAEIVPNFELPTRVLLWSDNATPALHQQAAAIGVFRVLNGTADLATLKNALNDAVNTARSAAVEAEARAKAEAEEEAAARARAEAEAEAEARAKAEARAARSRATTTTSRPAPAPRPEPTAPPPAPSESRPRDFTPARVTLPPVSERGTTAPPPAAPRGGLAARSKAAADRKPTPTQPEPEFHPRRSSGGNLVVTADNINPIRSIMSQLAQDLGAQSVMLTDRAGMVLVDVGSTDNLPMMIVLPLLSTSFSTAGEVARQLREEDAQTLYIHDGINYDLYCFDVIQRFLLVLVFNKKVASSKIGAVWVNAKRAIRELRDALDN